MSFIKLETNSYDDKGPIYVYINIYNIVSISRYKSSTNLYLSNGEHYIVKEAPKEIFKAIEEAIGEEWNVYTN